MILPPFHAKVTGPIMSAKHVAPKIRSFVAFSGVTAPQPYPGLLARQQPTAR